MAKPYLSKEPYHVVINGSGEGGGGSSMRFIPGEGEPGADIGAPGDVYLDTDSGDLYTNKNGTWALELNLKGPQGDEGPKGDPGEDGATGADGNDGSDGADGFPTESQWDALVARVEALESAE
ncbi:collagen-like protein [Oceanobacillus neutriphilus]|uniref:Collagen-like protein n=1 Tax=Oceanobacillus neutriphilus TaxID=531815 RepID=A0ABQ2NYD9_9BACI|nr:collagen-like protein [Oceanobacillus neutriphilus]GGP13548.1 hypothetical protein GCM10011346_33980 [Oceanobacillus neutriphilus]